VLLMEARSAASRMSSWIACASSSYFFRSISSTLTVVNDADSTVTTTGEDRPEMSQILVVSANAELPLIRSFSDDGSRPNLAAIVAFNSLILEVLHERI